MDTTAATVAHATSLFQTALLYTISSEAISSLIASANSSYIPVVIIAAFGGVGVAIHALNQLTNASQSCKPNSTTAELYQLIQHLLRLSIDILVQLASNGVGRLVLFVVGSASTASTVVGVIVQHNSAVGVTTVRRNLTPLGPTPRRQRSRHQSNRCHDAASVTASAATYPIASVFR